MKATELMLGDWVLDTYTNKPMRIESINTNMGEGLEPIPLTAEILEKNCTSSKVGFYLFFPDKGYVVCSVEGREVPFLFNEAIVITYVHELQHALRLCGIEKEIQL